MSLQKRTLGRQGLEVSAIGLGCMGMSQSYFKGIPYAGRVSGDRRFRRPAELQPWPGVCDALELGAPAIQPF